MLQSYYKKSERVIHTKERYSANLDTEIKLYYKG
jgi:hypothetical protein